MLVPGRRLSWATCPSTQTRPRRAIHSAMCRDTVRTGMGCSGLVSSGKGCPSGTYDGVVTMTQPMAPRRQTGAPRCSPRLLRRRRSRRDHRGEGTRPVRTSGLRPQADRAQQARRGDPRTSRGDLRRRDVRGARGRAPWSSPPTASRRPSTRRPRRGDSGRSTRPARWSPRSTTRRGASPHEGYQILLIGHEGHEEVVGTSGEAPEHITLVDGPGGSGHGRDRRPDAGGLAVADDAVGG